MAKLKARNDFIKLSSDSDFVPLSSTYDLEGERRQQEEQLRVEQERLAKAEEDSSILSQIKSGLSKINFDPTASSYQETIADPVKRAEMVKGINAATSTSVMAGKDGTPAVTAPIPEAVAENSQRMLHRPDELKPGAEIVNDTSGAIGMGLQQGYANIGKTYAGAMDLVADVTGSDTIQEYANAQHDRANAMAQESVMNDRVPEGFARDSLAHDIKRAVPGAVASAVQNLPTLAAGELTYPIMFGTSALSEYGHARQEGKVPVAAAARALPNAAFEVIGEKVGGADKLADAMRAAAMGRGSLADLGSAMISSAIRELPGEELTTTGQFLVDKIPGIGLAQDATMQDYLRQVKDTAIVTMLQSAGMAGAGHVISSLAPHQQRQVANAAAGLVPSNDPEATQTLQQAYPLDQLDDQQFEALHKMALEANKNNPGIVDTSAIDNEAVRRKVAAASGQQQVPPTPLPSSTSEQTPSAPQGALTQDLGNPMEDIVLPETQTQGENNGVQEQGQAPTEEVKHDPRFNGMSDDSLQKMQLAFPDMAGHIQGELDRRGVPSAQSTDEQNPQLSRQGTSLPDSDSGQAARERDYLAATTADFRGLTERQNVVGRGTAADPLGGERAPELNEVSDPKVASQFRTLTNALHSIFGTRTIGFEDTAPGSVDGFAYAGVNHVNVGNLDKPAPFVLFHEFTHQMQQLGKDGDAVAAAISKTLHDTVFGLISEEGKQKYATEFLFKKRLRANPGLTYEQLMANPKMAEELKNEMVADFMGKRATDRKFLNSLAKADPKSFKGFVAKWIGAIDNLIDKLRGQKGLGNSDVDGYISQLEEAKAAAQNALILFANHKASTGEAAGDSAMQFSRKEKIGDFEVSKHKDGSITVHGDPAAIRAVLPEGVKGRMLKGAITFTHSDAPRVTGAIEGRNTAYSRQGEVLDKKPMKNGKYVGAPAKFDTPAKIAGLRKWLRQLADEGAPGRYWYENSSREILRMVGGDVNEARKFVALLAIYSPQAKVDANSTFALRAWAQYKAGRPIRVKTEVMDTKAQEALDDVDKYWSGEKTGNFFNNLLSEIDPATKGKQGATIDMWMMRAGQYDTDAPTSTQYAFMEDETNRLARELGWEPQQVQAAIWVAMKARMENEGVKKNTEATSEKKKWIRYDFKNGKKTRVILDEKAHRDNWLKHSFAHDPSTEDTQQAKFDFSDGVQRHIGQVSFEARPGRTSGVLPGIHDATYEQQTEYQQEIQKQFYDENGNDLLAMQLGLLVDSNLLSPGVWQGEVSPSSQKNVSMAPAGGGVMVIDKEQDGARISVKEAEAIDENWKKNKERFSTVPAVDPAQHKLLDLYCAIAGLVTKQEGVGWHRPFYAATKAEANGLEVNLGRPATPKEAAATEKAVGEWMVANGKETFTNWEGKVVPWNEGFAFISSPKGIRLVNFGVVSNTEFQKGLAKHLDPVLPEATHSDWFASDGNMPSNNWKEYPDGSQYIERASAEGRSDVLGWARDFLAPRVQRVNEEFSKKYGWGEPGSIQFSRKQDATEDQVAFSRKFGEEVVTALKHIATQDGVFRYPKVNKSTFKETLEGIDKSKLLAISQPIDNGKGQTVTTIRNKITGHPAFVIENKRGEVWVNLAQLVQQQDKGSEIYAAVADYAFYNNKVFVGDPAGLSDTALFRRTENMLSIALKYGTTRHIAPHHKQTDPRDYYGEYDFGAFAAKAQPLRWIEGDDDYNIASLAYTSYTNAIKLMPELANAKWNEDTGKFEWADGRPFNADAIAKFSAARAILENGFGDVAGGAQGLAGAGREGHPLGRSTIKRVVLIGTVLRAASAEQREAVLSGLGTWVRGSSGSDGHGDGGAVSGQAGLNPDFKWLMYSRKEQTPFYSQLSKSIAEQPDRIFNQPAQSVATWLDANSGKLGIKKDELQWTGVLDWLRMQGKERVSKAQIDEFLQGNGVQVHETTLGGVNIDDIYEHLLTEDSYEQQGISIEHEGDAMYATYIRGQFDRMYQSSTAAAERVAELLEDDGSTAGAPKYASYQTPGGENYKELLLTLPEREPRNLNDISQEMFGKRFSELGDNDANAVTRAEREQKKSENFRSSHFDQPNILAHVRFNERTDADGNRVLFIEEIQSDFGQSYKKQRDAILSSVDNDFMGIVERMKKDGVLEVNCD